MFNPQLLGANLLYSKILQQCRGRMRVAFTLLNPKYFMSNLSHFCSQIFDGSGGYGNCFRPELGTECEWRITKYTQLQSQGVRVAGRFSSQGFSN